MVRSFSRTKRKDSMVSHPAIILIVGFHPTMKEELMQILVKLVKKNSKGRNPSKLILQATITLILTTVTKCIDQYP